MDTSSHSELHHSDTSLPSLPLAISSSLELMSSKRAGGLLLQVAAELDVLEDKLTQPSVWDSRRQTGIEVEFTVTTPDGRPVFNPALHQIPHALSEGELQLDKELLSSNLEGKSLPTPFGAGFLEKMERDLLALSQRASSHAEALVEGATASLCGILPSYEESDCQNTSILSTGPRYAQLNNSIMAQRNGLVQVALPRALDGEIAFQATNMTFEGTPTSVQYHYSTKPEQFVDLYTAGLVALGPVMAIGANSPLVFGQKGWKESRIGLLEGGTTPERFIFGESWPKSPGEIFREILRHVPLLPEDSSISPVDTDRLPNLCKHRGTVWNWLRACYGFDSEHGPHLRTEMRVLGAGPTEVDMVANAAYYYGLTTYLMQYGEHIRGTVDFEQIKENFYQCAKFGLDTEISWIDGKRYPAQELSIALLDFAKLGLGLLGVSESEADCYLNIVQERVNRSQTGADWILKSYDQLRAEKPENAQSVHLRVLVQQMRQHQEKSRNQPAGFPVAQWPIASYGDIVQ